MSRTKKITTRTAPFLLTVIGNTAGVPPNQKEIKKTPSWLHIYQRLTRIYTSYSKRGDLGGQDVPLNNISFNVLDTFMYPSIVYSLMHDCYFLAQIKP